jgi:hypothetical protein
MKAGMGPPSPSKVSISRHGPDGRIVAVSEYAGAQAHHLTAWEEWVLAAARAEVQRQLVAFARGLAREVHENRQRSRGPDGGAHEPRSGGARRAAEREALSGLPAEADSGQQGAAVRMSDDFDPGGYVPDDIARLVARGLAMLAEERRALVKLGRLGALQDLLQAVAGGADSVEMLRAMAEFEKMAAPPKP